MTTLAYALDQTRELTANRLANMAVTACPDNDESAGAEFLRGVRNAVINAFDFDPSTNEDAAREIADDSPSIYTYEMWYEFTDLGAFNEDISDLVSEDADMDTRARLSLYVVAERLARDLINEVRDAVDSDTTNPEDWGGDDE